MTVQVKIKKKSYMLYGDIYKVVGMNDCIMMGDFYRRGRNFETFVLMVMERNY